MLMMKNNVHFKLNIVFFFVSMLFNLNDQNNYSKLKIYFNNN